MSLKNKTIGGLFWTISQQASVQFINFIVQIVLARMLMPEDFGVIAMMAIFLNLGQTLMDGGLTSSLIRTKDADERDYSTVFYMNLLGSIFVYTLLYAFAPLIADFYNQEILIVIIRVYTFSIVIRAFMTVQVTRLTKQMEFKKQMVVQVPSIIGGGILGVVIAYLGGGVWSLVWMNLFQAFVATVMYWIIAKWHPLFVIDKEKLKYHFNFGYKLTLVNLINVIYQNSYAILIGRFFSATQLGYYHQASTLSMFTVKQLNTALTKVTYPMFSSIQDDDSRLKIVYRKVMQQVMFWVTPVMCFLAIVGEPLINIALTERWLPMVPYFQILCLSSIIYPLTVYNLNILNVKGRSDLVFKISLVKYSVIIIGMICIVPYGVSALVWFQAIATIISFFINTVYSGKMINYSVSEQIGSLKHILILGTFTTVVCWLFNSYYLTGVNNWLSIVFNAIVFFTIYFLLSYLFKFEVLEDVKDIIGNLLAKRKKQTKKNS